MGAGAILRAGGNRDPERLERRRQLAVGEREAAELGVGRRRSNGSTATTLASAVLRRAASAGWSSSADQLAGRRRRRCGRWPVSVSSALAARSLVALGSASAAIRACGLPSPVAIGTSAAARS